MQASRLMQLLPEASAAVCDILDSARGPLQAPIRSEIFGQQRLAQHGRSLGETHRASAATSRWATFFPRLRENIAVLRQAHQYIGVHARTGYDISPAAEWLLDNFHLIESQLGEIHEGLPRSRYGDQFKFAIMWENANKALPCPTSPADFREKLLPFWIEQYFRRPNYLVLDGRPVFSIYNAEKFVNELGGEREAAAALEAMREACVRAGFKGVHLLGQYCWGRPPELAKQAQQIQRLGLDASWAYHWPTFTGAFGGNLHPTGEQAIAAQERLWQTQPAPHVLTLSMGWDEAPWRFKYSKIQWRLTPAEFQTLCSRAKALLDARPADGLAERLVLLDNWNEFGEGHYLMPTREHGFGYLDAVRAVFAPSAPSHTDHAPRDLGLGPYDSQYRAWQQREISK